MSFEVPHREAGLHYITRPEGVLCPLICWEVASDGAFDALPA